MVEDWWKNEIEKTSPSQPLTGETTNLITVNNGIWNIPDFGWACNGKWHIYDSEAQLYYLDQPGDFGQYIYATYNNLVASHGNNVKKHAPQGTCPVLPRVRLAAVVAQAPAPVPVA